MCTTAISSKRSTILKVSALAGVAVALYLNQHVNRKKKNSRRTKHPTHGKQKKPQILLHPCAPPVVSLFYSSHAAPRMTV